MSAWRKWYFSSLYSVKLFEKCCALALWKRKYLGLKYKVITRFNGSVFYSIVTRSIAEELLLKVVFHITVLKRFFFSLFLSISSIGCWSFCSVHTFCLVSAFALAEWSARNISYKKDWFDFNASCCNLSFLFNQSLTAKQSNDELFCLNSPIEGFL